MRHILSFILLSFFTTNTFSQHISELIFEGEYEKIVTALESENWESAFKITTELVSKIKNDSIYNRESKGLNYILLFATAGMLNKGELTKDEAFEQVKHLKGYEMVMPAHPFNSNSFVNCMHLSGDEPNTFFSSVNNAKGTEIFAFQYVVIENGIKESKEELEGKVIVLEGVLAEIRVEGIVLPRFKLKFTDGKYHFHKE